MSDQHQDPNHVQAEGAPAAGATETFETYYDDEPEGSCWRANPMKAMCGLVDGVQKGVLRFLPPDVVEHLGNAQKEFLRAGVALAENRMRHIDETVKMRRDMQDAN